MSTLVQGLAPTRAALGNGAVVLAQQTATHAAVTMLVAVRAGSGHDPAERLGLAHFVSKVIDRGTDGRTADQIAEALDGRGVTLNSSVGRHLSDARLHVPRRRLRRRACARRRRRPAPHVPRSGRRNQARGDRHGYPAGRRQPGDRRGRGAHGLALPGRTPVRSSHQGQRCQCRVASRGPTWWRITARSSFPPA